MWTQDDGGAVRRPKPPGLMESASQEADNAFVRRLMPTTGRHTTKARKTANCDPAASLCAWALFLS